MKKVMKCLSALLILLLLLAAVAAASADGSRCTREEFLNWYEKAKERAAGADHLLGPGGDILNRVYTIIMPGETIAVLPKYGLDKDNEYSIQGGIMAFNFDIYQFDAAVADTNYWEFHRNTLPRTALPKNAKLTLLSQDTIPVPYGARIGLKEVEEGSTISGIEKLTREEQVEELAKLVGGVSVSDAARTNAKELIDYAAKLKK